MRLPLPLALLVFATLTLPIRAQEKKEAPKEPPFEKEIRAYEESDKTASPPQTCSRR